MSKRLHNVILSALAVYTSTHTQTWLQMEGGATRAHTILSLSLSCLLKHALSMCRPTNTDVHKHTLSNDSPPTPPVDDKLDPQVPEGRETERQRKRSVDPVMCV